MLRQIAFGFFYYYVLVMINFSSSCEVSQFRWMKSVNDEVLCATSQPNKTINETESRVKCVSSCDSPSSCQSVNYWKNAQLCEHFYYVPCSYDVQQDCANYQVTVFIFSKLNSETLYTLTFYMAILVNDTNSCVFYNVSVNYNRS